MFLQCLCSLWRGDILSWAITILLAERVLCKGPINCSSLYFKTGVFELFSDLVFTILSSKVKASLHSGNEDGINCVAEFRDKLADSSFYCTGTYVLMLRLDYYIPNWSPFESPSCMPINENIFLNLGQVKLLVYITGQPRIPDYLCIRALYRFLSGC